MLRFARFLTRIGSISFVAMALLVTAGSGAIAETITWTGNAGNNLWQTAGNWDLNRLPAAGDDVVIPNLGGTPSVTLSSGDTVAVNSLDCDEVLILQFTTLDLAAASSFDNTFTLSTNSVLTGAGNAEITTAFTWFGGTMSGTGVTTIAAGVNWTVTNANLQRTLQNDGSLVTTGSQTMTITNPGVFRNRAGASVDIRSDGSALSGNSVVGFDNQAGATLMRSVSTGLAQITCAITNNGTISHDSGSLTFSGGGANNSIMNTAAGTTLTFTGTFSHNSGASVTAGGTVSFFSGTHTFDALASFTPGGIVSNSFATLTLNSDVTIPTLNLNSGLAGSGDVLVTAGGTWSSGIMSGTGVTTFAPGVVWAITGNGQLQRTLQNDGDCVKTGATFNLSGAGTFLNRAGATFDIQSDTQGLSGSSAPGFFNEANAILSRSAGTGAAEIGCRLTNDGTVSVNSGGLTVSRGGENNSVITAAPGTALTFSSSPAFTHNAGSSLTTDGAVTFIGTNTLDAAAAFTPNGAVNVGFGTLTLNVDTTIPTLNLSGEITGSGDILVTTGCNWSTGRMAGTGVTRIAPGVAWTITGGAVDLVRTIENDGDCIKTGGNAQINGAGVFQNRSGASFDIQSETVTLSGSGGFENQAGATLRRTVGSGSAQIDCRLTNSGTVSVESGTLFVAGPFPNFAGTTLTGGAYDIAAVFRFSFANIVTNAATIVLDGAAAAIQDGGGGNALANLASNTAAGSLTLRNGKSVSTGAAFANAGEVVIGPGASVFTANLGYTQSGGTTTLDDGTLAAAAGVVLNGGSLVGDGTVNGNLTNGATVAAGASPGAINVQGTYTQQPAGSLVAEIAGTAPGSEHDVLSVSGAAAIDGNLDVALIDGFLPAADLGFDILTASGVSGAFASSNLPQSYAGGCLSSSILADRVQIQSKDAALVVSPPANQSACVGGTATFSVSASGSEPITFQWRKEGVEIPGETGTSIEISPVTEADAGAYDVVVSNACGDNPSDVATLTVLVAPSIVASPSSQTTCEGSSVVFTASASGTEPLAFQWRHDATPIPGENASTLTIDPVSLTDAGAYDVVVTNVCGDATSAAATLTVETAPTITLQPLGQTVCIGNPVTLSVDASGSSPLEFQWRKDGSSLPGENASTLEIAVAQLSDAGSYDAVVSNGCGEIASDAAALTVETCGGPTGACCFVDGSCQEGVDPNVCAANGGAYQGDESLCALVSCPVLVGACCFADGSCQDGLTETACGAAGGIYEGNATSCATADCPPPPPPTLACCFANGSCLDLDAIECAAAGGTPQSGGSSCATTSCPRPSIKQACCFPDGSCRDLRPGFCRTLNGRPQGVATTCATTSCEPIGPEVLPEEKANLIGDGAAAIDDASMRPQLDAYPNPSRAGETMIRLSIPAGFGDARVSVYDVAGRLVARIGSGRIASGPTTLQWDGASMITRQLVPPGTYFLRLEAGDWAEVRRITVIR